MASPDTRRTLLLLKQKDQVLLAMKKRGFGAGRWNGVGGKLEPGESLEQALVRECQEEINVTPLTWRLVAEHDFRAKTDAPWQMYVYAYICESWEGQPIETEEMAPQWFTFSAIPYDKMWQDDKYWLPLLLEENKKVVGTYTFDSNDNMLTHNVTVVTTLPSERAPALCNSSP